LQENLSAPTNNQIYGVPANKISPCLGTTHQAVQS
jgi:hypothetical protein